MAAPSANPACSLLPGDIPGTSSSSSNAASRPRRSASAEAEREAWKEARRHWFTPTHWVEKLPAREGAQGCENDSEAEEELGEGYSPSDPEDKVAIAEIQAEVQAEIQKQAALGLEPRRSTVRRIRGPPPTIFPSPEISSASEPEPEGFQFTAGAKNCSDGSKAAASQASGHPQRPQLGSASDPQRATATRH